MVIHHYGAAAGVVSPAEDIIHDYYNIYIQTYEFKI